MIVSSTASTKWEDDRNDDDYDEDFSKKERQQNLVLRNRFFKGTQLFNMKTIFHQATMTGILAHLNSGSTCSIICNKDLLSGIHDMEWGIKIRCNAGYKIVKQKGYSAHYGDLVWYCPSGIANILGLSQ